MTAEKLRPFGIPVIAVLLAFLGILTLTWAAEGRQETGQDITEVDPAVVRIYYDSIRELEGLSAYDVWEFNNTAEKYVLAALSEADQAELNAAGWRIALDAKVSLAVRQSASRNVFAEGYRTVDELYGDLDALAAANPQLTELVVYGQSECLAAGGCVTPGGDNLAGYELRALRITNESIPGASDVSGTDIAMGDKPVFFMIANIHSREITTPELAMRLADWLLDGYGVNADATWLVNEHEIWIVPTANPDGHWLVELGATPAYGGSPFYHRKNANQDADGDGTPDCTEWPSELFTQFGVDLNRNHTFGWGLPGSSTFPCDQTYRGPSASSELEVANLEALIASVIPDQRGEGLDDPAPDDAKGLFITLHSYSNLVLWPWGALFEDAPNRDGLKAIGDKLASFNGYTSCQPTACLYAASGASDDWVYGALGIPAFTYEIGDEFMPPYSVIDSVQWPENRPSFIYAARIARSPYVTALGPDSLGATSAASEGSANFEVVLNDLATGGNAIAAAELSIDRPFWDDQSQPMAMTASDGAFDGQVESAFAQLDVSGLSPGRHLIYFRGQDDEGNWGAVSAAFLEIEDDGTAGEKSYIPSILRP